MPAAPLPPSQPDCTGSEHGEYKGEQHYQSSELTRHRLAQLQHAGRVLKLLPLAGMNQGPRTLSYNPAENMVLITYEAETGGTYELYSVPKDTSRAADTAVGVIVRWQGHVPGLLL